MTTIITRTNGPDNVSHVVWAIRECFFISCYFLILTTVIYSFSNGPIRQDPVLLVPTSTSHSLPDASPYNPPPTPRPPPPPPPRKHPRGPNDEIQTTTITGSKNLKRRYKQPFEVSVSFFIYIALFF